MSGSVREQLEADFDALSSNPESDLSTYETTHAEKVKPDAEPTISEKVDASTVEVPIKRGADGKFQPGAKAEAPEKAVDAPKPVQDAGAAPSGRPDPGTVDLAVAPRGVGAAIRQHWATLPEEVKREYYDREANFERGFSRYKGLAPYADGAEKNGTTLQACFDRYVAAEKGLSEDPVNALLQLCRLTRTNPLAVAQAAGLYRPESGPQPAPPPNQQQPNGNYHDPRLDHVLTYLQQQEQDRLAQIDHTASQEVTQFLSRTAEFPYIENVRPIMAKLIETGECDTLEQAYEEACWRNRDVREALKRDSNKSPPSAKNRNVVREARRAAGGLTGSPDFQGSAKQESQKGKTARESLEAAWDELSDQ